MRVHVKCPTRIDLSGGTLDLWPLHAFIEGCKTINVALGIFTECEIETLKTKKIIVESQGQVSSFENLKKLRASRNKNVQILRPILSHFKLEGVRIRLSSESPIGAGLGGSSSLVISIITAICTLKKIKMTSHQKVWLAHNLEAQMLKTPTGTQDYVAPILGGAHAISYNPDGMTFEKLKLDLDDFNKRTLVVYTGRPHHSGLNNWTVLRAAVLGKKTCLDALVGIRDTTEELYRQMQTNSINFKKIFKLEYKHRTRLSKAFSSPEIRKLEKSTSKIGVEAIKICGAGGGGCVLLYMKPHLKDRIRELCLKQGYQVLNAKAVEAGARVRRYA